jgi:hypothetical protein
MIALVVFFVVTFVTLDGVWIVLHLTACGEVSKDNIRGAVRLLKGAALIQNVVVAVGLLFVAMTALSNVSIIFPFVVLLLLTGCFIAVQRRLDRVTPDELLAAYQIAQHSEVPETQRRLPSSRHSSGPSHRAGFLKMLANWRDFPKFWWGLDVLVIVLIIGSLWWHTHDDISWVSLTVASFMLLLAVESIFIPVFFVIRRHRTDGAEFI